jgi:hypothetical protein
MLLQQRLDLRVEGREQSLLGPTLPTQSPTSSKAAIQSDLGRLVSSVVREPCPTESALVERDSCSLTAHGSHLRLVDL